MKLAKSASGKTTIKMSKKEWTDMGKKAGWLDKASDRIMDWDIHCTKCRSTNVESNDGNNICKDCGNKFYAHSTSQEAPLYDNDYSVANSVQHPEQKLRQFYKAQGYNEDKINMLIEEMKKAGKVKTANVTDPRTLER